MINFCVLPLPHNEKNGKNDTRLFLQTWKIKHLILIKYEGAHHTFF